MALMMPGRWSKTLSLVALCILRALCESADWLSMKTFAVQRNPELVSRASKIGVGSHAFFELRCQHAACKKDDAAVSLHIVRQVDLGFWTEPAELLKEPACDLSGSQIKRSELRLQVFQDQLVRFYALIANDNPGELSVNRDEPQGLNGDVTQPRETLFQVELFDPIGGFDQSHIRRVSERCSPGDALKTIRIVHHADGRGSRREKKCGEAQDGQD